MLLQDPFLQQIFDFFCLQSTPARYRLNWDLYRYKYRLLDLLKEKFSLLSLMTWSLCLLLPFPTQTRLVLLTVNEELKISSN